MNTTDPPLKARHIDKTKALLGPDRYSEWINCVSCMSASILHSTPKLCVKHEPWAITPAKPPGRTKRGKKGRAE